MEGSGPRLFKSANSAGIKTAPKKSAPQSHWARAENHAAKAFKLKEAVGIVEILCQTRKTLLKSELIDILNVANKPVTYFTEDEFFGALSYLEKMGVKIIDNMRAAKDVFGA